MTSRAFTYEGKPLKVIKKSFATACERAGGDDFRVHDMRHTFASHLVQNGVPLLEGKELLGHKTLAMVMRYAHLAPDNLRSAIERQPGHSLGIVRQAPEMAVAASE
jgi:integrase